MACPGRRQVQRSKRFYGAQFYHTAHSSQHSDEVLMTERGEGEREREREIGEGERERERERERGERERQR